MPGRRDRYRNRWYEPGIGTELRKRYDDRAAYLAAYKLRWSDDEIVRFQEDGMQAFAALERRLLKRSYIDPFKAAGKTAFEALMDAISTPDRVLTPETDIILAAIDFEGDESLVGGVHGYSFATLDTRDVLAGQEEKTASISAGNFRIARHNRNFLFGETHRIELDDLRQTIVDSLTRTDDDEGTPRKVLLVGHGIEADIRTLRYLNIDLEHDLTQVIGIIDTSELARPRLGQLPSLRTLLEWLNIPHRRDFFHCAGK